MATICRWAFVITCTCNVADERNVLCLITIVDNVGDTIVLVENGTVAIDKSMHENGCIGRLQ